MMNPAKRIPTGRWRTAAAIALVSLLAVLQAQDPHQASASGRQDASLDKLAKAYQAAVEAAKFPSESKISKNLLPIRKSTDGLFWDEQGRVLMATWTKASYYQGRKRGDELELQVDTWLTAAPFMRRFCRGVGLEGDALRLRIAQRLGMPPGVENDSFLQIWIDPSDFFRPCPDPEVGDQECQVSLSAGRTTPQGGVPWDCSGEAHQVSEAFVQVSRAHLDWMCRNWKQTYSSQDPLRNYPWTALGYTYDWGSPLDPVGASEFVAPKGRRAVFHSIAGTDDYCAWP